MHNAPFSYLQSFPKVCKHGDRWNLVFKAGGRTVRKYIGKATLSEFEAEQIAVAMLSRMAAAESEGKAVKELLNEALEVHVLELWDNTATVLRCVMKKYFDFLERNGFADKRGTDITHEPIELYRAERMKYVKMNTVRKEVSAVKALYNRLNKQGVINVDTRKITCKKSPEAVKETYTPEQLNRLFDTAREVVPELQILYGLVHYAFIRPAEVLRLTWSDVDLMNGTITIPGDKSKNKKTETVEIPEPLYFILKEFYTEPDRHVLKYYGRFGRTSLNVAHKKILKKAGLPPTLTIYALKHTGAQTLYRKSGNDLKLVQNHCRHSSSTITDTYLKNFKAETKQKLEGIGW